MYWFVSCFVSFSTELCLLSTICTVRNSRGTAGAAAIPDAGGERAAAARRKRQTTVCSTLMGPRSSDRKNDKCGSIDRLGREYRYAERVSYNTSIPFRYTSDTIASSTPGTRYLVYHSIQSITRSLQKLGFDQKPFWLISQLKVIFSFLKHATAGMRHTGLLDVTDAVVVTFLRHFLPLKSQWDP